MLRCKKQAQTRRGRLTGIGEPFEDLLSLLAIVLQAIPAVPREIEMEMVAVKCVGLGPQYGGEVTAGAAVDRAQKFTLGVITTPASKHRHLAPIGQDES